MSGFNLLTYLAWWPHVHPLAYTLLIFFVGLITGYWIGS